MTRHTFNALIKLFAISVNRKAAADTKSIMRSFKSFLEYYLEAKYVNSFLVLFENYLEEYSSSVSEKKLSLNSVKLISFCQETAENLNQTERSIIIFNLIRLIHETDDLNDSSEFIKLVGEIYEIAEDRVISLLDFFLGTDKMSLKLINDKDNSYAEFIEFSNGVYALKNISHENFLIDSVEVKNGSICYALKESVIALKDQRKLFFSDQISDLSHKHSVEFCLNLDNVSLVKNKTNILNNISIEIVSGEFIGVIGNSGSGKSSLLNIISGREKKYTGDFAIKSTDKSASISFASLAQDSFFIPGFTAKELLVRRCEFLQIKKSKYSVIIDKIAELTGISSHLNKIAFNNSSLDAQLSGGQQKRLAIATELISEPDVFILDEHTSGLSSEDTIQLLSMLKRLCSFNKIVIASVHQADYESLLLFDKILILDDNAYPVFYGPALKASEYLRQITDRVDKNSALEISKNPSVLLNILNHTKTKEKDFWYKEFKSSEMFNHAKEKNSTKTIDKRCLKLNCFKSFFSELKLSYKIEIKKFKRPAFLLFVPLIIGLVLGLVSRYSDNIEYNMSMNPNIPIWLFMIVISSLFIGMLSSSNEFIKLREFRINEYYLKNKYYSQIIASLFKFLSISLVQGLILILPSVYILEIGFISYKILLFSVLLIYWGSSFGILLSVLFRHTNLVNLIIPIVIIVNMLFTGVIIKFDHFNKDIFGESNKGAMFIANTQVSYHALNALMVEFYTFEDKENLTFKDRIVYYESVYYLDYFIPLLKDIAKSDSVNAERIIENESNINLQFPIYNENDLENTLINLEDYYQKIRAGALNKLSKHNLVDNNRKSNKYLSDIVENYYSQQILIDDGKLMRQYMCSYLPPYYMKNNLIFSPYKSIFNKTVSIYHYSLFFILISIGLIFILSLLLKSKYH